MLTDLNVPWPAVPNKISLANLSKTLSILRDLGYTVVALNYTIDGTSKNPLAATTSAGGASAKHNVTDAVCQIDISLLPVPIPAGLRVLRRVTLVLDDSSNSHQPQRLTTLGTVYDIVAVRPKSERTLLMACTALDGVDIISLDMTVRYPCVLRHRTIGAAVGKGIKFEIAYAGGKDPSLSLAAGTSSKEKKIKLTSASAEAVNHLEDGSGLSGMANPESRRQLISNAAHLLRSSRGRGLLIKRIFLSGTTSNSNTKLTNSTATPYSFSLKHQHYLSTSSIASASFATSNGTNNTSSGGSIPRPDLRKTNTFTTTKLVTDELNCNNNSTSTGGISVSDDRQARKSSRPYSPFGSYWHAKARLIKPLEPSVSAKAAASTNPQQQQRERFTPSHTPTSSISSVQSASPTQYSSPASSVSSSKRQHHRHVQQPGPDIQYVLTELARREQVILDLRQEVAALEADLDTFKSRVFPAAAPAPPSPAPSENSTASTPSSTTSTIVGSEVSGTSANADVTSNVYKTLTNNVSMLNVGIGLWALGFGLGKQFVFGY